MIFFFAMHEKNFNALFRIIFGDKIIILTKFQINFHPVYA